MLARDERFGPCPKCEAEKASDRLSAAKRRFNLRCNTTTRSLDAEVAYLRKLTIAGRRGMEEWEYWEGLADFADEYAKKNGWR